MANGKQAAGPARPAAAASAPQKTRRRRRRKRAPRRPMSIRAVCRAAAKEGVSYGVYVLRHGV